MLYGKWQSSHGIIKQIKFNERGFPAVVIEPVPKGRKEDKEIQLFRIRKDKQRVKEMKKAAAQIVSGKGHDDLEEEMRRWVTGELDPHDKVIKAFKARYASASKDRIPGGLADKGAPKNMDPDELEMGIKVEMEHTDDQAVAREIAKDHLTEDPLYYTKLKAIEKKSHEKVQRIKAQLTARRLARGPRPPRPPMTQPRYDATYAEGLSWLERIAFDRQAAKFKKKKKVKTQDGDDMTVYEYSDQQIQHRNREKATRIEKLRTSIDSLRSQVNKDLGSKDEKTRLTALAVGLMDHTYERVGNDSSAKEGHFGVTGFKSSHVTFSGGTATIKYVGKSGVKQEKKVTDKKLVSALKKAAKGKDCLFDCEGGKVDATQVNSYLKEFDITAKDIRGLHANREVQERLKATRSKGPKLPSDPKKKEKLLKDEFKKALEEAAKAVGHEPSTLKSQYLVPGVYDDYMDDGKVNKSLKKKATDSDVVALIKSWEPAIKAARSRAGEFEGSFEMNWLSHIAQSLHLLPRLERKGPERLQKWLSTWLDSTIFQLDKAGPSGASYPQWVADLSGDRTFPDRYRKVKTLLQDLPRTARSKRADDVPTILSAIKAVGINIADVDVRKVGPTTILFWQGEGGGASVSVRKGENWEVRMWVGDFDPQHRRTDTDVSKTPKDVARYFALAGNGGGLRPYKTAKKDQEEKEEEHARAQVKPEPKYKPPRPDRRHRRMTVDDPDMDDSGGAEKDDDLSLNYKMQSRAAQLASRYLNRPDPLRVAALFLDARETRKPGDVWETDKGEWAGKNSKGETQNFGESEKAKAQAEAWAKGKGGDGWDDDDEWGGPPDKDKDKAKGKADDEWGDDEWQKEIEEGEKAKKEKAEAEAEGEKGEDPDAKPKEPKPLPEPEVDPEEEKPEKGSETPAQSKELSPEARAVLDRMESRSEEDAAEAAPEEAAPEEAAPEEAAPEEKPKKKKPRKKKKKPAPEEGSETPALTENFPPEVQAVLDKMESGESKEHEDGFLAKDPDGKEIFINVVKGGESVPEESERVAGAWAKGGEEASKAEEAAIAKEQGRGRGRGKVGPKKRKAEPPAELAPGGFKVNDKEKSNEKLVERAKEAFDEFNADSPEARQIKMGQIAEAISEVEEGSNRHKELEVILDGMELAAIANGQELLTPDGQKFEGRDSPPKNFAGLVQAMAAQGNVEDLLMPKGELNTPKGRLVISDALARMDDRSFSDYLKAIPDGIYGPVADALTATDSAGRNMLGEEQRKFLLKFTQGMLVDDMTTIHHFNEAQKKSQAEAAGEEADPMKDAEFEALAAPDEAIVRDTFSLMECLESGEDLDECEDRAQRIRLKTLQRTYDAAEEVYGEVQGSKEGPNPDPQVVQLEMALELGDPSELDVKYEGAPDQPGLGQGRQAMAHRVAHSFLQSLFYISSGIGEGHVAPGRQTHGTSL